MRAPDHEEHGFDVNDQAQSADPEAAEEIAALRAEIESLNDKLLRVRADTDNYRKRLERTTEDLVRGAKRRLFMDLLSLADDLERALAAPHDDGQALAEGVDLTLTRLQDVLAAYGVRRMESGGAFDPNLHEAVATAASGDVPDGHILDEVSRGYLWGDMVLRAARVRVAVAPDD